LRKVLIKEGRQSLEYIDNFITEDILSSLLSTIDWQQREIKMFGKMIKEPRLTMWYGEKYSYSGVVWPAKDIPEFLRFMMHRLSAECSFEFNSVLVNHYRDGQDSMGWHRDNETEINSDLVASVSFGSTRKFGFRNRKSKKAQYVNLDHGSLLLMQHSAK
jgi:alkylated DNA repair dioxygenase AlkB